MTTNSICSIRSQATAKRSLSLSLISIFCVIAALFVSACQETGGPSTLAKAPVAEMGPVTLREGDVIRVSFPGSTNLDTTQPIRRDGRITLPIIGEIIAIGKSPTELEKSLLGLYADQIVSKEISVSVVSSSFTIFVTGAVLRPGKIQSDRPLNALEAIMEAGGFDYAKANLRRVTIIRTEGSENKHYYLDLKATLDGQPSEPFYLKPSDIIYIPERSSWL